MYASTVPTIKTLFYEVLISLTQNFLAQNFLFLQERKKFLH